MGRRRTALRLRLAALEVLPQGRAQTPALPDLLCALGTVVHWLKTTYRGRLAKGLGAMTGRRTAHACASSGPVAMGRRTQGRFPFAPISPAAGRCRSSVVEHPLGKGEVVSSILTGSTNSRSASRASGRNSTRPTSSRVACLSRPQRLRNRVPASSTRYATSRMTKAFIPLNRTRWP